MQQAAALGTGAYVRENWNFGGVPFAPPLITAKRNARPDRYWLTAEVRRDNILFGQGETPP